VLQNFEANASSLNCDNLGIPCEMLTEFITGQTMQLLCTNLHVKFRVRVVQAMRPRGVLKFSFLLTLIACGDAVYYESVQLMLFIASVQCVDH